MEKEKSDMIPMPERSLRITLGNVPFDIDLPNTGQEIDIEVTKDKMSRGSHGSMLYGDAQAMDAYMNISALATFSVLIPDLNKSLNIESLSKLDMMQMKEFKTQYQKYYDWISQWRNYCNQDIETEEEEKGVDAQ